ncbi:hypothetical protein [Tardiphaga sp.]|jgi:hypothetical protein|uniref:hypothetical protein n=1 Tax=Tardiphaga sp. TaxID=1926292 RepID=UPI0034714403
MDIDFARKAQMRSLRLNGADEHRNAAVFGAQSWRSLSNGDFDRPRSLGAEAAVVYGRRVGEAGVRGVVLHRDVFWLGKQWAVTGYGVQAVSKKHNMKFDIDVSQIWGDDLDAPMRDLPWFDAKDFAEAVERARKRATEQPLTFRPPLSDER